MLISRPQPNYEPSEECGAPMDPQQRYCVNCAARRGNGANPASRYFAAMSKRARRPTITGSCEIELERPGGRGVGFFALLPIAVAIGVVVGRADTGGGDEGALLKALRQQNAATATYFRADHRIDGTDGQSQKSGKDNGEQPPRRSRKSW